MRPRNGKGKWHNAERMDARLFAAKHNYWLSKSVWFEWHKTRAVNTRKISNCSQVAIVRNVYRWMAAWAAKRHEKWTKDTKNEMENKIEKQKHNNNLLRSVAIDSSGGGGGGSCSHHRSFGKPRAEHKHTDAWATTAYDDMAASPTHGSLTHAERAGSECAVERIGRID